MSGRLQSTLLTWYGGSVLQVCRVRSSVLRLTLSVLPYLLRLFLRSSPSGRPRSVVPSRLRPRRSEKSCKQRFGVFPIGKAGQSRKRVLFLLGQAFRSETGSLFRPVVRYLGQPRSRVFVVMSSAGPSFCWKAGPSGILGL